MEQLGIIGELGRNIFLHLVDYVSGAPYITTAIHLHVNQLHLVYIVSGHGVCLINNEQIAMEPGLIITVFPNEIHQFMISPSDPYSAYFLHIKWYGDTYSHFPRQFRIRSRRRNAIVRKLKAMKANCAPSPVTASSELRLYGLFVDFLADLMESSLSNRRENNALLIHRLYPERRWHAAVSLLQGPPFVYPGIDLLAERMEMSRRAFTACFKKRTGMSIKQYFLRNVMIFAHAVMKSDHITVNELAMQCGYSTAQNFKAAYRHFVAHCGNSDKAFHDNIDFASWPGAAILLPPSEKSSVSDNYTR